MKYRERKITDKALKIRLNHMAKIAGIIQEKDPSAGDLLHIQKAKMILIHTGQESRFRSSAISSSLSPLSFRLISTR